MLVFGECVDGGSCVFVRRLFRFRSIRLAVRVYFIRRANCIAWDMCAGLCKAVVSEKYFNGGDENGLKSIVP